MDYVIGYDISDDKVRTTVFNTLKYLGAINVQRSVFVGVDISKSIYMQILDLFKKNEVDSYFIVKIKLEDFDSNCLDKTFLDVILI